MSRQNEPLAAPPVTSLREQEAVAWQLSHRRMNNSIMHRNAESVCISHSSV